MGAAGRAKNAVVELHLYSIAFYLILWLLFAYYVIIFCCSLLLFCHILLHVSCTGKLGLPLKNDSPVVVQVHTFCVSAQTQVCDGQAVQVHELVLIPLGRQLL